MKRQPFLLAVVLALAATICGAQTPTLTDQVTPIVKAGDAKIADLSQKLSAAQADLLARDARIAELLLQLQVLPPATRPTTQPATQPADPPATQPTTPPAVAGRPSRDTTGVQPGTVLKSSGTVTAKSGQVIEGLSIKGYVSAAAGNVTIRNCRIDATGSRYGVNANNAPSRVLIEDCEIWGMSSKGVYGDNVTVRNCYIHDSAGDGAQLGDNSVFEGNYVTRLGMSEGAHADGVQVRGGSNIQIRGNYFDMPKDVAGTNSNAGVFAQLELKAITIEKNWFRGGNYIVCVYDDGVDDKTSKVTGNLFYRGSAKFGFGRTNGTVTWSGNVDENGKTVAKSDK